MSKDTARSARTLTERLFIGIYPAGLSYADRAIEEHGDYAKVAFLSYASLDLTVYCDHSPLLPLVREDAARMQARRGEEFQVSTAGQTVRLGAALPLLEVQGVLQDAGRSDETERSALTAEQQAAGHDAELDGAQERALRKRMHRLLGQDAAAYRDGGGEWLSTQLAEDAANDLRLTCEDSDATIPERIFELAREATESFDDPATWQTAECPDCQSAGPHPDNGRRPSDADYAVKCLACGHERARDAG